MKWVKNEFHPLISTSVILSADITVDYLISFQPKT